MRTPVFGSILMLAAMLWAPPATSDSVEVRKIDQNYFLGDAERAHIDLSFGNLQVEGTDGRNVQVELRFDCSREDAEKCRRAAERIVLAPRLDAREFVVRLKRTPRGRLQGIAAHMLVRIPENTPLEIDLRAGNVSVTGMKSHVEVDVGAGDVNIEHTQRRVQFAKADIGVGGADLWVEDAHIEGTGFPKSFTWRGSGEAQIEVDVGTGDVDINLK